MQRLREKWRIGFPARTMENGHQARVLALAVEVERERIGDMDADCAEHPFRQRGALLLDFGQQDQESRQGGESGASVILGLLRGLYRFGETEQRVRQAAPLVTDGQPRPDAPRPQYRLASGTLPTQGHCEIGLVDDPLCGDRCDSIGRRRQIEQRRFVYSQARNRGMLDAQCRAIRIGAARAFQPLRQIDPCPQ